MSGDEPIECYRGPLRVHSRIRAHTTKDTYRGEMAVYFDRLVFRFLPPLALGTMTYEIPKVQVSRVDDLGVMDVPWFLAILPVRRYGVRVISKPGGSFGDHDDYALRFDNPPLGQVLNTLRVAGYPVTEPKVE